MWRAHSGAVPKGLKALYDLLPPTTPSKYPALFAAYAVATPFLRDFEKSGIHLPSSSRAQFVTLSQSILQLGRKFLQNASEPRDPILIQAAELEEAFGAPAVRRMLDGDKEAWIDPTSWEGRVLARQHPKEDIRRRLYLGANSSPTSHVQVLEELLRTRGQLARLVGRDSWADVALEDKMAKTPENVMGFLEALNKHNRPLAAKDMQKLQRAKKLSGNGNGPIHSWDRDYYSDLSNESASNLPDISPFFSVGACLSGLSQLFSRLYGIRFEIDDVLKPGETWSPDVRKLRVIDEDEGRIGTVYCDLFAREGKQPGAAHYTVRCSRRVDDDDIEGDFNGRPWAMVDGVQVSREEMRSLDVEPVTWNGRPGRHQEPIVVLVCGFGSETGGQDNGPSFLQWHEVETLFHEMGHCIHCKLADGLHFALAMSGLTFCFLSSPAFAAMIGRTDYHNVSGTRCATDFVELPSILMEHFISSPSVLSLFAKHPSTGRTLPSSIIDTLLADRQRLSALETSSQITMAALDQQYHTSRVLDSTTFDSTAVLHHTHEQFHVIAHATGTTWQTQFGHLFGYGATYYSYLFDRAIAARIFGTKFAANPLDRRAGDEFKKRVLVWGGGKEPWDMIADMVGVDEVAKGGQQAMRIVGEWGIEDTPRGA